ncbi:PhzF family phenazine biosynthesis protein [Sorangium sp. So ce185]|uniref:PhzF family phenazine biosynthesis protein n=1 Tax=Sorangium sp. So ce185 TaxID=3133287 RepID=UPI003F5E8747
MRSIPIYQVDAFTSRLFAGNPAAVMLLDRFLDDSLLRDIAAENNLAETAFLVPDRERYRLRWFTPTTEVPLCGHATLASAAVIMERLEPGRTEVIFESASGPLTVRRTQTGYAMNFPSRPSVPTTPPPNLAEALGAVPVEVLTDTFNYIAVLEDAQAVRALSARRSHHGGIRPPSPLPRAPRRALRLPVRARQHARSRLSCAPGVSLMF